MKRKMNICLLSLAILLICTFTTSVFAVVAETPSTTVMVEKGILLKAIEPLIQETSRYYEISKTDINDVESVNNDGLISTTFNATLTMCLKFKSVSDFPYMKGMLNNLGLMSIEQCTVDAVVNRINNPDFKASALGKIASTSFETKASSNLKDNLLLANSIINEINSTKNSLEEYIGMTSDFDYSFLVTTLPDGTIVDVKIQNFEEYIPAEEFYPESEAEMMNSGSELLVANVTKALSNEHAIKATTIASPTYNRTAARDYVQTYSSEASVDSKCPHGNTRIDLSKYNPDYTYYCHNDCANYVSQGIYAGSIPKDSTWSPGTSAWINVSSLRNYFLTTKGYWTASNYTNANAGGIIININSSGNRYHVNMIVLNDTVTRKYAAHNSDHINRTYTSGYWGSGETQEYYVFNN